jgi:hypothetical protein
MPKKNWANKPGRDSNLVLEVCTDLYIVHKRHHILTVFVTPPLELEMQVTSKEATDEFMTLLQACLILADTLPETAY